MASGRLFKRSGTKFRFRGLPEDPKIIITDPFYEEKGGMTTTTRHDNTETPEPSQPPSSSHSGMKYLVRTSPHFNLEGSYWTSYRAMAAHRPAGFPQAPPAGSPGKFPENEQTGLDPENQRT